jgi:hypothetical protein
MQENSSAPSFSWANLSGAFHGHFLPGTWQFPGSEIVELTMKLDFVVMKCLAFYGNRKCIIVFTIARH